jgi:hypothetical protein
MGSTREARRAGRYVASSATAAKAPDTTAYVIGSSGPTPNARTPESQDRKQAEQDTAQHRDGQCEKQDWHVDTDVVDTRAQH